MSNKNQHAILGANNLTCIRDSNVLFENLNFAVKPGELLIIEGKNGSGKTSLLKILSGICQQDDGEVSWDGENIEKLGAMYRQNMAYLGHRNGIKYELTAIENLQMASIYGKASDISISDALETTGLGEQADLKAGKLSAGQKRRLAMARLLLTECSLWLLDEPLASLDRPGINLFERLLEQHLVAGGLAVMSSHHEHALKAAHIIRMSLDA